MKKKTGILILAFCLSVNAADLIGRASTNRIQMITAEDVFNVTQGAAGVTNYIFATNIVIVPK